jgi:hypothetical protein
LKKQAFTQYQSLACFTHWTRRYRQDGSNLMQRKPERLCPLQCFPGSTFFKVPI